LGGALELENNFLLTCLSFIFSHNFWIDVIDNFLAIINPHFPSKPPSTKT
jgi:hypothetical protein